MHTIDVHFQRFSDIAVPDLFGAIGVYVLCRAIARLSYIGEGNILSRLVTHHGTCQIRLMASLPFCQTR